ncbi:MAG: GNAT family N-acetyltransferase, partial [Candidatus Binatia bacterium]
DAARLGVRVLGSMHDVSREAWDALVGDDSPFLEWDWLAALEEAGTVDSTTGWLPQHLTLWEGDRLVGACPLYVKAHSLGEFVFDQGWATAAARARIAYYPKLLAAVPFTPVTGGRLLARAADVGTMRAILAAVLENLCGERGFSSVHVNFCRADEVEALAGRGWLRRTGYQYHWRNEGYGTFDDYLASLRGKRRNQVQRERRELETKGIEIRTHAGDAIGAELGPAMYRLYRTTIDGLPWGQRYLNQRFFELAIERVRHRLCLVLARQGGEIVAGTFNVRKGGVLYGRYWGTLRYVRHLHFNVCYYAAIEHCIHEGLTRFEPGAGGEFKHLRGFDATPTESMHWIHDRRLRAAVRDYLENEREAVSDEIEWYDERTSLKRDRNR